MTRISSDNQGRKYVERADGSRAYVPTTSPSPEAIEKNAEQIRAYHRSFEAPTGESDPALDAYIADMATVERELIVEAPDAPTDEDLVAGEYLEQHFAELTDAQKERAAELVADSNPRHAIEGWAGGSYGEPVQAIFERALAILDARSDELVEKAEKDARVEQLREVIREAELELEKIERPDIAELREELDGIVVGLAIARSEQELRELGHLAYNARDRVYQLAGAPPSVLNLADEVVARARARFADGGRA